MALGKIQKQKTVTVVGLNSGTSADGLDLAAVSINCSRTPYRVRLLKGITIKYPRPLALALDRFIQMESVTTDDLIHLDQALGKFYGRAARAFIKKIESSRIKVTLIASHGQTVRHLPAKTKFAGESVNGTLQLGSLTQIATQTGRLTVGNFRQGDIALGNEGAPITVAAMRDLCADQKQSRLIVNLGGMANYFYFPAARTGESIQAADCGPGNYLSDRLTEQFFQKPFDRGGRLARQGELNDQLLDSLKRHPFFKSRRRSTGIEQFGATLTEEIAMWGERKSLAPHDLLATVAMFTVVSITRKLKPIIKRDRTLSKLYLTGGGVHNSFIMNRLQEQLDSLEVVSIDQLGLDPDRLEAMAYAVMGAATIKGRPLPTRFDKPTKPSWPILGEIVQPPVKRNGKNR